MRLYLYKGFSLIEMIIVLVIMGIISATLIPLLDTKQVKINAAQRYASEILQVINAEQNYYMRTIDTNTSYHVYTSNLEDLVNKDFLGKLPSNPFYGAEGNLKIEVFNNAFVEDKGSDYFTLTFQVPKDVLGVFYNSIPGLEVENEEGNKITVKTTIHIPGLEASLDNLMHRDAGVDQELRTSHGPIQVTDNVSPKKSYIYVTNDNKKTPQNLYINDANNISPGYGVIKMGSITDNLDFGITGGDKNGNLIISANKNKQPGTLQLGYDEGKGVGSNRVIIGIGKYIGVDVKKGAIYFYGLDSQGNNPKIASVTYYPKEQSPNPDWGSYSAFELKNPYSKNGIMLASFKDKPISSIAMGAVGSGKAGYRSEWMTFNASGDKPISFIGSIGGIFENVSETQYQNLKILEGEKCAAGRGVWKLIATGVTSANIAYKNPGSYDYKFTLKNQITGTPAVKNTDTINGINLKNIKITFSQVSSPKTLSAVSFNMNGASGAGVAVKGSKNIATNVNGSSTGTYLLVCVPDYQENSNYNKAVNGYYTTDEQLGTDIGYQEEVNEENNNANGNTNNEDVGDNGL